MNNTVRITLITVVVVLFQTMVFNNVHLGKYATILIYPLLVLILPISFSSINTLLYAFFVGLFIDMFSVSWGVHSAAFLVVATFRNGFIKTYVEQKDVEQINLQTVAKLGVFNIIGFFVLAYLINVFLVVFIEYWSLKALGTVLLKTIVSTFISAGLSLVIAMLLINRKGRY